jgi:glycosyltransferase involved in cell wall biosynthesis
MENPLISVIIPVFNGEKFIADAIQSVLKQDYKPLEIIVVDDGSTDKTAQVVKNFAQNITYLYQENAGISASRNKGLEHANGELIAFIDADDIWTPTKLAVQLRCLQSSPDAEIAWGFLLKTPFHKMDELYLLDLETQKGLFSTQLGTMLIKKQVFEKIGCFDLEMQLAEDLDWINRMREVGTIVELHNNIVQFNRWHGQNITSDKQRANSFMLKAYKKSLDRRRRSGGKSIPAIPKLRNFDELIKFWQNKH